MMIYTTILMRLVALDGIFLPDQKQLIVRLNAL